MPTYKAVLFAVVTGLVLSSGETQGQELNNCNVRSPRADLSNYYNSVSSKTIDMLQGDVSNVSTGATKPKAQPADPSLQPVVNNWCDVPSLRMDASNYCNNK